MKSTETDPESSSSSKRESTPGELQKVSVAFAVVAVGTVEDIQRFAVAMAQAIELVSLETAAEFGIQVVQGEDGIHQPT